MIQPAVQVPDRVLHVRDSVIVKPTPRIHFDLGHCPMYVLYASSGSKALQVGPELLPRLWMNADIYASAVLPHRKAEEFKISDREHTDRSAFLPVQLRTGEQTGSGTDRE